MTLDTFFEKFELLADAPDAVGRMRELVLRLAVKGGLVPNDQNESAVPYSPAGSAVPINTTHWAENWRVVLLSDVVKNRSGNSKLIKGKLHNEPAGDRYQGFSASGADVWCDSYEQEGEAIIISAVGARCGKAFKATGKWCAIANTNIVRPDPKFFDFNFSYLIFNDENFWVRGGSAQPFVKFPPSLDRHFALPPLAEQKRIVAKVEELMALCDRLEAQQQDRATRHAALARASLARFAEAPTPAHLDLLFHPSYDIPPAELRKAILTLAVQGKLVAQDASEVAAEELLRHLEEQRAILAKDANLRLPKNAPPVSSNDSPHRIPQTWQWARLGGLALVIDYGTSQKSHDDSSKVPVYRMGNIVGGKVIDENLKYVDQGIADLPGLYLKQGDILFNRTNSYELVGKSGLFTGDDDSATFASYLIRIRLPKEHLLPSYFSLAMNAPYFRQTQIEPEVVQQCGQANFNGSKLANTLVPVPPLNEQRRIVAKVEQLMALVSQLEAQLGSRNKSSNELLVTFGAGLLPS